MLYYNSSAIADSKLNTTLNSLRIYWYKIELSNIESYRAISEVYVRVSHLVWKQMPQHARIRAREYHHSVTDRSVGWLQFPWKEKVEGKAQKCILKGCNDVIHR